MKYSTTKVGLMLLTILSMGVVSACSSYTVPYRTYNMDRSCHYYYVDSMGQRVTDGRYSDAAFTGLALQRDSNGRWYYQDNLGNRIYMYRHC